MLIPNHPDDERLSALAAHDDDAVADASLSSHVSTCIRCTELVAELGELRVSLAELPDVAPHRPLQLLPPVGDAPAATGAAGWVRRLFAPALTAGAAVAMVGLVGTAGPLFGGMASSGAPFQNVGTDLEAAQEPESSLAQVMSSDALDGESQGGAQGAGGEPDATADQFTGRTNAPGEVAGEERELDSGGEGGDGMTTLPAERSIWPMVLFSGIALMLAAALLRWILVPRAG
jgi:hypothetical protein